MEDKKLSQEEMEAMLERERQNAEKQLVIRFGRYLCKVFNLPIVKK
jgi:hypothetical protein